MGRHGIEIAQHRGQQLEQTVAQIAYVCHEHARVPIKLTALHKHLGKISFGFFGERLYLINAVLRRLAQLNVAISRLWSGGLDAQGEQLISLTDKSKSLLDVAYKGVLVLNHLVGRRHQQVRVGVESHDAMCGPCHAWCRVAVDGFGQDAVFRDVGQLLMNVIKV